MAAIQVNFSYFLPDFFFATLIRDALLFREESEELTHDCTCVCEFRLRLITIPYEEEADAA